MISNEFLTKWKEYSEYVDSENEKKMKEIDKYYKNNAKEYEKKLDEYSEEKNRKDERIKKLTDELKTISWWRIGKIAEIKSELSMIEQIIISYPFPSSCLFSSLELEKKTIIGFLDFITR